MEIGFLDTPAGGGKTEVALKKIINGIIRSHLKAVLLSPTTALAGETERRARETAAKLLGKRKKHLRITRIDGSTSTSVVADAVEHLKEAATGDRRQAGELLLITHKAFQLLPYFHDRPNWEVVVDEAPTALSTLAINLPRNHRLLTDHLEVNAGDALYGHVQVRDDPLDRAAIEAIAENAGQDEFDAVLREMAAAILDENWIVRTNIENWHRHLAATVESHDHKVEPGARGWQASKHPLAFFAVLKPAIFRDFRAVTILAANFKSSLLFKLWRKQVRFRERADWRAGLRYTCHPNGGRVHLSYATNGQWSRRRAESEFTEGVTWQEWAMQQVREFSQGMPFIYSCRKDQVDLAAKLLPDGVKLPNSPHGLNSYSHYHYVAAVGAFLPDPWYCRYLANEDITHEEVLTAIHRESVYQAIMRSSLRDLRATETVHVMVPDEDTAVWLADQFDPASPPRLGRIGVFAARYRPNRKWDGDAERNRARRAKEEELARKVTADVVEEFLFQAGQKFDPEWDADFAHLVEFLYENRGRLSLLDKGNPAANSLQNPVLPGTAFDKITKRGLYPVPPMELEDWFSLFEDAARRPHVPKSENLLICPAYFCPEREDPEAASRARQGKKPRRWGRHNVGFCQILILDFEKGVLSPEQFRAMFPGLAMVLHASSSASPGDIRYHVLIPLSRPVTAEQYIQIAKRMKRLLERDKGYASRLGLKKPYHGLDSTVLRPEAAVYAPSTPKDPTQAYYVTQRGELINVDRWIDHDLDLWIARPPPPPLDKPDTSAEQRSRDLEAEKAKEAYRSVPDGAGRHDAFFTLARRLYRLRFDQIQVRQHLVEADYDGHQARKGQVDRCVDRVPKYLNHGR